MPNPLEHQVNNQPAADSPKLSQLMSGLVTLLRLHQRQHWTGQKVHVPEITAGAYFVYEQMRNAVEYRERHLFLRGAIERFLLRELKSGDSEGVGLP
jgi:hypothetical protein